ncbi:MAG: AAA family ATPase [Veillonellaceae bacterium]|nr:AAA family ATPase [Veillonellaceae bacterium]
MKTVMPIGTEYFAKLRANYYFVDKTTFLSDFFRGHADVTLITRPRRFGKTLLLSMTQQFLDIEDAEKHRKLFEGLKVMDDPVAMAEQGTRPVVFMTLRDWDSNTWESMQEFIAFGLQSVCRPLRYLLESDKVSTKDKKDFDRLWNREGDLGLMRRALPLLCEMLRDHYGRDAVLLIDEYDAPLQSAWSHGYYEDAIDFYRGFFASALKSNPALDFAILTGVLRIAKESIFSGLNNLKVSTVLRGGFADACGYTKAEVAKLAHDLGHEDKLEELASWYDGYDFQGTEIYNPWSVNNYFSENCEAEAYWVNTSGNSILQTMLERIDQKRARDFVRLMEGKTICTQVEDSFIYQDIEEHRANLYALLLTTGYLKCVGRTKEDDATWYDLALPNRELRSVFRREIMKYLSYDDVNLLYDLLKAMQEGDTEEFEEDLQTVLRSFVSCHDAAHPESFYHGLMLGLTVWLEKRYRIQSNKESGYGRFDLAFFPKKENLPGILLEFKAVKDEADLSAAADAACQQIEEKAYLADFQTAGVADVWRYGIAFCKKQVIVKAG